MNDTPHTPSVTLDSIRQQKAEALHDLRAQKRIMADTARELFAPLALAADRGSAIMRAFNTGMAVFDGVMLGVKLMRKVRKAFK